MQATFYGLKNCDTCRKALKWLKSEGVAVEFRDVRADGLPDADLKQLIAAAGPDKVLNRKSTTWRALSEGDKLKADKGDVAGLLKEHPTLMKRPAIRMNGGWTVGFDKAAEEALRAALSQK